MFDVYGLVNNNLFEFECKTSYFAEVRQV